MPSDERESPPSFEDPTPTLPRRSGEMLRPSGFVVTLRVGPPPQILALTRQRPGPYVVGSAADADGRVGEAPPHLASFALEEDGLRMRVVDPRTPCHVGGIRVVDALLAGGESVSLAGTEVVVNRLGGASRSSASPAPLRFGRLEGESSAMARLYPVLARLAKADVSVVLEGETGTGKELAAEELHRNGPRCGSPFVVFDCAAVTENLVEAALFGHARGAFTGAEEARRGVFEQAHGGTLLLDELGELSPALQAKLLRVVERRQIRRLGSHQVVPVDVRILSATRRDLAREVREGRFREDLYHRLAVARVRLPPLRERRADVPMLVRRFCAQVGASEDALAADLVASFQQHPWPGNVRELRNAVHRFLAVGQGVAHGAPAPFVPSLDAELDAGLDAALPLSEVRRLVQNQLEARYLAKSLGANGGSVTRAAAASGIARRHFQRLAARARKGSEPPPEGTGNA